MSHIVPFNYGHINISGTKHTKIRIMEKLLMDINLIFAPIDYFNHYADILRIPKEISCTDKLFRLINYLNLDKWILAS